MYKRQAQAVLDGLNGAGEDAALFSADSVRAADAVQYDKLALGCPAMGAEVLEESVFEPFFTELEPLLSGDVYKRQPFLHRHCGCAMIMNTLYPNNCPKWERTMTLQKLRRWLGFPLERCV